MEAEVKEWSRNGSFMKKPTTGWLHDDAALNHGDGVYYPVKARVRCAAHTQYVGKVGMAMSMRTMRFEDRTAVTRCVCIRGGVCVCRGAWTRVFEHSVVSSM